MYKQTLKAIMTLFLAGSATIGSAANDTMPLHSGWKFRQANRNEWHPATVPGVVHTDLLDNALLLPFVEKNTVWVAHGTIDGVVINSQSNLVNLPSFTK